MHPLLNKWVRLRGNLNAKITKQCENGHLAGYIFDINGHVLPMLYTWHPESYNCMGGLKMFDIMCVKMGDDPKGWPEWTK